MQLALPTGYLEKIAKLGYGASAKTLFGFGRSRQQVTFEVGFNTWQIKDKYLPPAVDAQYRSIPLYAGYRLYFGQFYAEQQVGAAFNTVFAENQFNLKSRSKLIAPGQRPSGNRQSNLISQSNTKVLMCKRKVTTLMHLDLELVTGSF